MSAIPMPVQAGADVLASYPLVEQMFSRHGCTRVDADGIETFLARPGHALLVFTEDPMRYKETLDLAVIVPQLQRAFPGRFVTGVLLRNWDEYLEELQALLSAAPSRPPTVGIPVRGPGGAAGSCAT